mgnify:CR=1 FL=1
MQIEDNGSKSDGWGCDVMVGEGVWRIARSSGRVGGTVGDEGVER